MRAVLSKPRNNDSREFEIVTMPMRPEVTILSLSGSDQIGRNLAALASAMGLGVRPVVVTTEMVATGSFLESFPIGGKCVLTTSRTLAQILQSKTVLEQVRGAFLDRLDSLFVVGFSGEKHERFVLDALTGGTVNQPVPLAEADFQYAVSPHSRDVCPYLAGLTFGPVDKTTDFGFVVSDEDDHLVRHIQISNLPFFLELKTRRCRVFLLACSTVADIDAELSPEGSLRRCFSHLIPEMFFLRHMFDSHCWHTPERFACFIVDDPLLRERYGFLEYGPLLEAMDQYRFFTTIAFIPWNYRRTKSSVARLFKERLDRFSLSVHGCDHTEAEYASGSHDDLLRRTRTAWQRMTLHRQETGVDFDPVMIFPMGSFSTKALRVLKSCGFLGAVNSTAGAVDQSVHLSIRGLLELPAVQYEGFPLFLRRYPEELSDFALDLFLGKPALIVEHHDYFREGPDKLVDFVSHLNRVAPDVHWRGLGTILERAHLEKTGSNGVVQVKFYTRVLRLNNQGNAALHYVLRKAEAGGIRVSRVLRDDVHIPFSFDGNDLVVELDLPGGAETVIQVECEDSFRETVPDFTVKERFNAGLRRLLSEFRDNYLSRNDFLMRAARRLKAALYRC